MSDIKNLVNRIAAASLREDWFFIEDVLSREIHHQRQAAVEDYKDYLRRLNQQYSRGHVIFETADGLRQTVEWPFNRDPVLKRACRSKTSTSFSPNECTCSSVAIRAYEYVGDDSDTGLPVYRELSP